MCSDWAGLTLLRIESHHFRSWVDAFHTKGTLAKHRWALHFLAWLSSCRLGIYDSFINLNNGKLYHSIILSDYQFITLPLQRLNAPSIYKSSNQFTNTLQNANNNRLFWHQNHQLHLPPRKWKIEMKKSI
jgi:hypothetical protein